MHKLHSVARRRTDPIRVLVVDDEPQICEFVSRILSDAGYQVTTATDGLTGYSTSATVAELPQAAAIRSLLAGLAKNPPGSLYNGLAVTHIDCQP